MKVSIIIPNYNKAPYIKETLDSILKQSYQSWEAIIVDDGSTDESVKIINNYLASDTRFKFYKRDTAQKGGSVCRNIGLKKASGNFIIFLDSDDILQIDCLKNRIYKINNNGSIDFAIFSGGTFYKKIGDSKSTWIPPSGKDYLKLFLVHSLPWHTSSVLWKKEFLNLLNGFNESYHRLQDVELHTRALIKENAKFLVFGGEPDFYYRIDENRKEMSSYEFLLLLIDSSQKYCTFFMDELDKSYELKRFKKYLHGTTQVAYITVQNTYDSKLISLNERNELFNLIRAKQQSSVLLNLYVLGIKINLHRIKGYNFLMKKLLTTFK